MEIRFLLQFINTEEYHGGFKNTDVHPASDFGDPSAFGDLDPEVTKTNTVQCAVV